MLASVARNLSYLLRITSSALEQLNASIQSLTTFVDLISSKDFSKTRMQYKVERVILCFVNGARL